MSYKEYLEEVFKSREFGPLKEGSKIIRKIKSIITKNMIYITPDEGELDLDDIEDVSKVIYDNIVSKILANKNIKNIKSKDVIEKIAKTFYSEVHYDDPEQTASTVIYNRTIAEPLNLPLIPVDEIR